MADDFTSKANEITNTLDRLVSELAAVEERVSSTSDRFSQLADQASRVEELNSTVGGLRQVLDKLDAPFLAQLEESATRLNRIFNSLNPAGLRAVNSAYSEQIAQVHELIRLQSQLNSLESPRVRPPPPRIPVPPPPPAPEPPQQVAPIEKPRFRVRQNSSDIVPLNTSAQELLHSGEGPSYLLNAQRAAIQSQLQTRAQAYLTRNQPASSFAYTLSSRFGVADPRVNTGASPEALVQQVADNFYKTTGNKVLGAQGNQGAANQLAVERAIANSKYKLAVVTTTGASAAGASLFTSGKSGQTGADHVVLAHQDEEGNYHTYEMNPSGSLAGSQNKPRRSLSDLAGNVDRVEAVSLNNLSAEQAEAFVKAVSSGTGAEQMYSFFNKLGNTCASVIAEKVREVGIDPKFGKPTAGVNTVTPSNVLDFFSEREGVQINKQSVAQKIRSGVQDFVGDVFASRSQFGAGFSYATQGARRGVEAGGTIQQVPQQVDESQIRYNVSTGKYATVGNNVPGATAEEAAANKAALLRALGESKYGVVIGGNVGTTEHAGASKFGQFNPEEALDHVFVAIKNAETGAIELLEMLNSGRSLEMQAEHGGMAKAHVQVPARSFDQLMETADRVSAVPVNFGTKEQVDEFVSRMRQLTNPETEAYSYKRVIDPDTSRIIGETCGSAVARAGRDSGLFNPNFGTPTSQGSNYVLPSQVFNMAEALNEQARRADVMSTPVKSPEEIAGLFESLSQMREEFNKTSDEYETVAEKYRRAVDKYFTANPNAREEAYGDISRQYNVPIEQVVERGIYEKVDENNPQLAQRYHSQAQQIAQTEAQFNAELRKRYDFQSISESRPTRSSVGELIGERVLNGVISVFQTVQKVVQDFADALRNATSYISDKLGIQKEPSIVSAVQAQPAYLKTADAGGSSALPTIQRSLEGVSSIYRNFQFATSQGGAIFNSVLEAVKGAQIGGPAGFLDISGALIKAVNAIVNLNNKFNLGLIPKGVGELFTQRRSDTAIDIIEIIVGGATGVRQERKTSADKNSGVSRGKEAARKSAEKKKDADENAPPIPTITPEDDILQRADGTTGPAAGPNYRAVPALRERVKKFLSEQEQTIAEQTEDAIRQFAGTTGFSRGIGSGFAISSPDTIRNVVQAEYGIPKEQTPENILGISLSGRGGSQGAYGFVAPAKGAETASSAIHELAHELVDAQIRQGSQLYKDINDPRVARAKELLTDTGSRVELYKQSQNLSDPYNKNIVTGALRDVGQLKYMFKPEEIFANVSQALITGNRELQQTLEQFYGPGLYTQVVQALEREIGDVFSPAALSQLQSRYGDFKTRVDQLTPGQQPAYLSVPGGQNPIVTLGNVLRDEFRVSSQTQAQANQFPQLINGLGQALSNPAVISQVARAGLNTYLPFQNKAQENLYKSFQDRGAGQVFTDVRSAIRAPDEQNIRTAVQGFKRVFTDIPSILRGYVETSIKETNSVVDKLRIVAGVGLLGTRGVTPAGIIPRLAESFLPADYSAGDIARKEVYKRTGSFITSEESSPQFDPGTGRFSGIRYQAQSLNGAMTELNIAVDAFGRKSIVTERQMGILQQFKEQVAIQIPRALTDNLIFGAVNALQQMFQKLVSIQDELGEVANLFGAVGDKATTVKTDFLAKSIDTAVQTGQGFQEGVQTNLRNLKVLGSVPDTRVREDLANQLSRTQLGAQTVFGISLEQSLESIPSILSSIRDGMQDITDPTERTKAAIAELNDVMDKTVVVQRASGAQGDELITIYSRLASSAKEYGLNSAQLLALSASSSVAIGKGSDETSNILRSLLEGTYSEANESSFQKAGISTKVVRGGQIENRGFADVLKDVYALSQQEDRKVDYQHLLQSIAGPKLAPDFAKVVQGFGTNYGRLDESANKTVQGTFDQSLQAKIQNFGAALNSLEASGTKLFNSFLVGTGLFDKFTQTLSAIAKTAGQVGDFFDKNRTSITGFVRFLEPIIKFLTIGTASKSLNVFEFIPKVLGRVETSARGALAELFDFFAKGESGAAGLQKNLSFVAQGLRIVTTEAERAAGAVHLVNAPNAVGPSPLINPAAAAGASNIASEEALIAQQANLRAINTTIETLEATANTQGAKPGLLSDRILKSRTFTGLAYAGDALGTAAAPAGFDLLTGGFDKENLTNIGVGIAGAFAGATVGPMGAALGYTFAKSAAENLDLFGAFGTSKKEIDSFVQSIAGKSEADKTPEEKAQEKKIVDVGINEFKTKTNYDAIIPNILKGPTLYGYGAQAVDPKAVSSSTLADYQRLVVKGEGNGILDSIKGFSLSRNDAVKTLYEQLSKSPQLLQRYIDSGVSNIAEFNQLLDDAAQGKGAVYKQLLEAGAAKLNSTNTDGARAAAQQAADAAQKLTESVQGVIDKAKSIMDDATSAIENQYSAPYGLPQFGAFSPQVLAYQNRFQPTLNNINSGKLTGQKADIALQSYDLGYQSITQLPNSLQQVLPLANRLGQNTDNINQLLYGAGSQGQSNFLQQIAPVQEADKFVQQYESKIAALKTYSASQLASDARIRQEYDTLNKTIAAERTRYDLSKQYLQSLGGQTNLFRDQLGLLQQQNHARRLISAAEPGTPATFSAPSLVDAKDYTSAQLTKAISDARAKQAQLSKFSPGYAKYFADQQFMLSSGNQFAGVSGVDQNFFNESLQAQKQQLTPPQTVDLSQFSDAQTQKILSQARSMQDQAVKLAPDLAQKYEGERLLVMRKNNQLLLETGLSQDYLRQAIQDNTKSNDQLRGHYNLPGSYRVPTVFDYYASGGKETGQVNYPSKGGQATLDLAQKLAEAILNAGKTAGKNGPDLSQVTGTTAPGGLKYYTGGTPGKPAVYSEEPKIPKLPDTDFIPPEPPPPTKEWLDEQARKRAERFQDLKYKQLDALDKQTEPYRPKTYTDPSTVKSNEAGTKAMTDSYDAVEGIRAQRDSLAKVIDETQTNVGIYNDSVSKNISTSDYLSQTNEDAAQKAKDFAAGVDTANQNILGIGNSLATWGSQAASSIGAFANDTLGLSGALQNITRQLNGFTLDRFFAQNKVTVNINGVAAPNATVTTTTTTTTTTSNNKTTSDSTSTSTGGQPLVAGPNRNHPISAY